MTRHTEELFFIANGAADALGRGVPELGEGSRPRSEACVVQWSWLDAAKHAKHDLRRFLVCVAAHGAVIIATQECQNLNGKFTVHAPCNSHASYISIATRKIRRIELIHFIQNCPSMIMVQM